MKKLIYTAAILLPLFSFAGPSGGAGGGSTVSIKNLEITVPSKDVSNIILNNGEVVPPRRFINSLNNKVISIDLNATDIVEIQFNNGTNLIIQ